MQAQVIVKRNLRVKLRDFKSAVIKITDVRVKRVGEIKLIMNIKHNSLSDLVVKLISPEGREYTLMNRDRYGKGKLKLKVTQDDGALANIMNTPAQGDWTVIIRDEQQHSHGVVTFLFFEVKEYQRGDDPVVSDGDSTSDRVIDHQDEQGELDEHPAVIISDERITTEAECHRRWDRYLAKVNLDSRYERIKYLCNDQLISKLRIIASAYQRKHSYHDAREFMFSKLDNAAGVVCGVYTGNCIRTSKIPSDTVMNCEHTWPKSKGAGSAPAIMDLHHLFPTMSRINSSRSSYPFCEVTKAELTQGGSSLGIGAGGKTCFEPRDIHKGDVARAMFYFSMRYNMHIDSKQESYLRKWNKEDPTTRYERIRNKSIEEYQGNSNPFVEYPGLVQFIANF